MMSSTLYRLMEALRYNDSNRLFSGHELDMFSNILMFSIKQPTYIIYKRSFIFLFIHKFIILFDLLYIMLLKFFLKLFHNF